jgi:hypothetical protein
MQPPYSPSVYATSRSRIFDSLSQIDSLKPWWSHFVIKHYPFRRFGVGSMDPATSPFALLNYCISGASPFSISPFLHVTLGYDLT